MLYSSRIHYTDIAKDLRKSRVYAYYVFIVGFDLGEGVLCFLYSFTTITTIIPNNNNNNNNNAHGLRANDLKFKINNVFLLFSDDCEAKEGTPCQNGACLDSLCHCNDGYGGCSCQVPGTYIDIASLLLRDVPIKAPAHDRRTLRNTFINVQIVDVRVDIRALGGPGRRRLFFPA